MSRPPKHIALAALLAALGAPAGAQPAVYRLDPAHSFVHFEVMHFGTSTLRGRFGPLEGFARLDRTAARGEVTVRVPTRVVSTGLPVLDGRLRQADMLASDEHPDAFFVAEHFVYEGARLREVRGELTLRGISRPLALLAQRFSCGMHPLLKREWCGGDFEAELRRSDYDISFGLPLVADRVRLLVQVEAIRDQ
ncbi:YceI family protein [uncultured Piscinibacter sp.]|uniref:YceI family protein n=1 Tax=uncultured Piscinibacter sp. TaxID=1131835 RepID=UPI0026317335|nr:YceI family protein [uncultured Piscinibacter sp.]